VRKQKRRGGEIFARGKQTDGKKERKKEKIVYIWKVKMEEGEAKIGDTARGFDDDRVPPRYYLLAPDSGPLGWIRNLSLFFLNVCSAFA